MTWYLAPIDLKLLILRSDMFGSAENHLVEVRKNVTQTYGIKDITSMAEFTVGCIFLLIYGLKGGCRLLIGSVQSLNSVWLFATPWTAACQASLSITNSWSLLKLMSIELVMPANHLILCHPLLLLLLVLPSIRVFSIESVLHISCEVLELQLQHQAFQ